MNVNDPSNRRADIRERLLSDFRSHQPLTDLLAEAVDDPAAAIQPKWVGRSYHNDEDSDPPEAMILLSFVTNVTERDNAIERKNYTIQIEVEISPTVIRSLRQSWIDEVNDVIDTRMIPHSDMWNSDGLTGGIIEPQWFDDRGRFVTVERYDIWRRD